MELAREVAIDPKAPPVVAARPAADVAATVVPAELPLPADDTAIVEVAAPPTAAVLAAAIDPVVAALYPQM